jgi:excisionase family DNA binding protein
LRCEVEPQSGPVRSAALVLERGLSVNITKLNPATAPAAPESVGLSDVLSLLQDLRNGLNEVRATLRSRHKALYTVEEVAEMTGRTPYTVRRWISEQRIKAIRISGTGPKGRLLIPREQINNLIESGLGGCVPDVAWAEDLTRAVMSSDDGNAQRTVAVCDQPQEGDHSDTAPPP